MFERAYDWESLIKWLLKWQTKKKLFFEVTIDKHLGMSVFQQSETEETRETMYSLYTL